MLEIDIRSKSYSSAAGSQPPVLKDVHLRLERASFTCLVGPSGCGKTTLLRLITGLDSDFEGSVTGDFAERTGMVFQEPRLLPWRDVETNIRLAQSREQRGTDLAPLLDVLGLGGKVHSFPGELSLGQARRAALARAFAIEPLLLLLDEPFTSLDGPTAERLRAHLLAVWESRPTCVLMVTHDLYEAASLADEVALMGKQPTTIVGRVPLSRPRQQRDAAYLERTAAEIAGIMADAASFQR